MNQKIDCLCSSNNRITNSKNLSNETKTKSSIVFLIGDPSSAIHKSFVLMFNQSLLIDIIDSIEQINMSTATVDPIWKDRIERALKSVSRTIDLRQRADAM